MFVDLFFNFPVEPAIRDIPANRIGSRKMNTFRHFIGDVRGNIGLLTAISAPVLVLMAGGAVDYAQKLNARTKLQTAVDAALLATAVHRQSNSQLSLARLRAYFDKQLKSQLDSRMKKVVTLRAYRLEMGRDESLTARVDASTRTRFLRLAAIDSMDFSVRAQVKSSQSRTEVALVLDVTGSMAGSKLAELKRAANSFLDTIDARIPDSNPDVFKVAIVPFSQYVNVGMQYRNAGWIDVPPDGYRTMQVRKSCYSWRCTRWRYGGRRCRRIGNGDGNSRRVCGWDPRKRTCLRKVRIPKPGCGGFSSRRRYIRWEGCVGSRNYPLNVRDGSYSTRVPGVMNYARKTDRDEWDYYGYTWDRNYCPRASLLPLTSVKTSKATIKRKISSLNADGWTYIPSGLMWGWRVLSSQEPFTQGADDATVNDKNVRKVIVLMTDGENTRAPDTRTGRSYRDHTSGNASYANQITRELCENIKRLNPVTGRPHAEIVTITFDVNSPTIKKLLKDCSTLGSFDVKSGQLTKIFEQVARQLVELHLSQ